MEKFENEFEDLFENLNENDEKKNLPSDEIEDINSDIDLSEENILNETEEADNDLSSSDSELLDLNSYFTVEDENGNPTKIKNKKPKKPGKKSVAKKILTISLAVFLVIVILGCAGAGAIIGMVLTKVDGTMQEDLNALALNYTTTIYCQDENGEWVEYRRLSGEENRLWKDYNRQLAKAKDDEYEGIPQYLADAFVAIEDKRFFDHEGVDWKRTIGAFVNMVTNRTTSGYGGSSITQQLVKNLTKDNDRSAKRKVTEIMRARYLESKYTKETILECYMNTIAMGNGLYGVGVAAEYYFGKSVNELTLAECASIAGITNLPEKYRPDTNPKNNKERRDLVLDLMHTQKLITTEEYENALKEPLNVVADKAALKQEEVNNYFVDKLIDDVVAALMEKYGWTKERAETNFYLGGYKIYSTVNSKIQDIMESVYEDEKYNIEGKKGEHLQGSMVVMDYSGHVLGMVGGMGQKDANRGLNRATMSPRQPGSTIKPLSAYAPAIERNLITYSSIVDDASTYYNNNTWRPTNWYKKYKGKVTVEYALEISMNTIPVYLVDLLTKQASFNFITGSLGLDHLNNPHDVDYSPLGMGGTNGGVTTLESAAAFAIFGNKGKYYEPITFTKITDQFDNVIITNESTPTVAIAEDTAVIMNKLLQNVVKGAEGTGKEAKSFIPNMDFYAKTGTANHANDIWFVGGSPYYVGASWCGYDELQKISDSKQARKMWGAVMSQIHEGLEPKEFEDSEFVEEKLYCMETGLLATTGCPVEKTGWYKTSGQKYCDVHQGEEVKANTKKEIKDYLEEYKNRPVEEPEPPQEDVVDPELPDDGVENDNTVENPDNLGDENLNSENTEPEGVPTD